MTHTSDERFLKEANTALNGAITAYRTDRTENPHISEAEFLHGFGRSMIDGVKSGAIRYDELVYSLGVALSRLAAMEPYRAGIPPVRLFVAAGHTDQCVIGTDLPGSLSMTCTCGGYRNPKETP